MLCSLHITDPLHTVGIHVCLTLLFLLTLIYSVSSNYHNNCYDLQQIIVGDMNVLVQVSLMWSVEHCKILHQINLQSRRSILIRSVSYFISTLQIVILVAPLLAIGLVYNFCYVHLRHTRCM